MQALLGNQAEIPEQKDIFNDRGKAFYKYEYETCKSNGPERSVDFVDTDKSFPGIGDGVFERDHMEPKSQHAKPKGDEKDYIREYLIIAFWNYDDEAETVELIREFTVEQPIAPQDNVKPLHISEQAKCAFWFDKGGNDDIVYNEVSLTDIKGEHKRIPIRPTNEDLTMLLSDATKAFVFSLTRINTADGEPILVYSKPRFKTGVRRSSLIAAANQQTQDLIKQTTMGGFERMDTILNTAKQAVQSKNKTGNLLELGGVNANDDSPLVELKFFSLNTRSVIYTIENADSLLEYNQTLNELWVLRVHKSQKGKYQDEVTLIKWDPQSKGPADEDMKEAYLSTSEDSDIIAYRMSGFKCIDIYFSSTYNKLVLLSANKLVTMYDLDQNTKEMNKRKHVGLMSQIYICKGETEQETYLCQISQKDLRDLSKEDIKKIPDSDDLFELLLFDINSCQYDKPFEPQFSLTTNMYRGFALGNNRFSSGIFLNQDLEVYGPVLDGDRGCFGFVRSDFKEVSSIRPKIHDQTFQVRYPCLLYRTPHPSAHKVFVENLYEPERVRILDLGEWTYVCGVENVRKGKLGLKQPFTAMVKSPQGDLCIVLFKVNPFETDLNKFVTWEVLGVIQSISGDAIITDKIVNAKLLQGQNVKQNCVIVQYEGELLALKVNTENPSEHEMKVKKAKQVQSFLMHQQTQTRGGIHGRNVTTSRKSLLATKLMNEDPFKMSNNSYKFGEKLCETNELLSKSILVSKNGLKVYFCMRNIARNSDQVMSVSLPPMRVDQDDNSIEVKIEKVFELQDSRIIYFGFDLISEQQGQVTKDAFYILDSKKKIHRLVESIHLTENEDGLAFQQQSYYKIDKTIDLQEKLGAKTQGIANIEKIFNTKWPHFNITMRTIQFKNITVGLDCDQIIKTLGENTKAIEIMGIRGTTYLGGHYKTEEGAHIFFAKPNMGSRAIDCIGMRGPTPTQAHIVGNGLLLYSMKGKTKETTKIFNSSGRYFGTVKQPRERQTLSAGELENLVPIKSSYDSQYFLLVRQKGFENVDGKRLLVWEGGVSKLTKEKQQYGFEDIIKMEDFKDVKETPKSERMNMFFQVDTQGKLFSIEFQYNDNIDDQKVMGSCTNHARSKWCQMVIRLPQLKVDDPELEEKPSDIHVDLTKNYIVVMRRNGQIMKIAHAQLTEEKVKGFIDLEHSPIDIPIANFYEDKTQVDEIGLKWMFVEDLVQFKLKSCLIHYDLTQNREVACLNNYQDAFENPARFVLTPFFIPVRSLDKEGKIQCTRQYVEVSHNQTLVLSTNSQLNGRTYNLQDELSLHNLKRISKQRKENKSIKIDPMTVNSTYMGNSVFHLCFNNYKILEQMHHQILGTTQPGEVGEITGIHDNMREMQVGEDQPHFSETPWFRRIVQLLIRKNLEGDSPLNLAIQNKNFRCFELMLSILNNARDVFVSKNFLSDLGQMIEMESKTVDQFFNQKFVENKATIDIEKVKWTIEEESVGIVLKSQLFTPAMIEEITCPPSDGEQEEEEEVKRDKISTKYTLDIHAQLVQQDLQDPDANQTASLKSVDAKLCDLDWIFQDGNGRRVIMMLAMTSHEDLFSQKQVTTVIDLLWSKYQDEIFKKVFMPYCIYFAAALIYFTFFLRDIPNNWFSIILELSLRLLVVINMVLFEAIEVIQMQAVGFQEYIFDFWNILDQLSFVANLVTLILHSADSDVNFQKTAAAISIFLLYVKFFYWLRLFDGTAAFIRMLGEICIDIVPFLTFLVICIAMFGNTFLLFDQSRKLNGIENLVNQEVFGIPWIDAFVRSYMVGLGEFDMENFGEQNNGIIWFFFLLSTFVTQLLFMNLLIAIMGDTFDRVQEMKVQAAAKEKISMITDFIWVLDIQEQFKDHKYILLVDQQTIGDSQNVWEGKIGQLKAYMQHQNKAAQSQMKMQFTDVKTSLGQMEGQVKIQQERLSSLQNTVSQISNSYKKGKKQTGNQLTQLNDKLDLLLRANGQSLPSAQLQVPGPRSRRGSSARRQRDAKPEGEEAKTAIRSDANVPGAPKRGESVFDNFDQFQPPARR